MTRYDVTRMTRIAHKLMASSAALLFLAGIALAGSEGPGFPLVNLAGLGVFGLALKIAARGPA